MTLTASPAYEPSGRTAAPRSRTVGILSIADRRRIGNPAGDPSGR